VVGKDEAAALGARHSLASDLGFRAVSADHAARAHGGRELARLASLVLTRVGVAAAAAIDRAAKVHEHGAIAGPFHALESAVAAHRAGCGSAFAQPLVELLAVDKADKAAFDRNVHLYIGRGHHAGAACPRDQQVFGDGEILDQTWRNGSAARLDAPGAVEQQHLQPRARQIVRCGGPGRSAADDHDVVRCGIEFLTHGLPRWCCGACGAGRREWRSQYPL
jgi:hypothetical protein